MIVISLSSSVVSIPSGSTKNVTGIGAGSEVAPSGPSHCNGVQGSKAVQIGKSGSVSVKTTLALTLRPLQSAWRRSPAPSTLQTQSPLRTKQFSYPRLPRKPATADGRSVASFEIAGSRAGSHT